MTWAPRPGRIWLVAVTLAGPIPVAAAGPDATPVVTLAYQGVGDPAEFAFTVADRGAFTKPAGRMRFDLASGALPDGGVGPGQTAFCCDPLTPIYAGQSYPFAVESLDEPRHYGLPDSFEGRASAARRASAIKELYGRHYQAVSDDPANLNAAFQIAVWEVMQEPDLPANVAPKYDLFDGQFRASAANVEAAPAAVREAQRFVGELNGDSSLFTAADILRRQEVVRLTGLAGADGIIPQSQIALVPSQNSSAVASGGGLSAIGPGFSPTLLSPGGGGFGGSGFPAGGASGLGGGVGGGGGGGRSSPLLNPLTTPLPVSRTPERVPSTEVGRTDVPGGRSPQRGLVPDMPPALVPPEVPGPNTPPTDSPGDVPPTSNPPRDNPPANFGPPEGPTDVPPGTPIPPSDSPVRDEPPTPPAVPAPPAVILGMVGVALFAARRWRKGR